MTRRFFKLNLGDKKNKFVCLTLFLIIFSFIFQIFYINLINNSIKKENQGNIQILAEEEITKQWLENSKFDSPIEPWFSLEDDTTGDVEATTSPGQANFKVVGDQRTFSNVSGVPQTTDWKNMTNSFFPAKPDNHYMDSGGCHIYHQWEDGSDPDQSPSVNWDRNITMPVDMSDYVIENVSLTAVVNASVNIDIDAPGDPTFNTQGSIGDYVKFYVLFSDLEKNRVYEVAYNKSYLLGLDTGSLTMGDTLMTIVPEESLIFYLTSVLESNNYNFTITVGMRLFCEDNVGGDDTDTWNDLCIKSCNLTFTYVKKMTQSTSVSWKQIGDEISGKNIEIIGANLKFKYKIDQDWPTSLSPNSEIRSLINNNPHTETIKLSMATTSFQDAKDEGFDVSSLIQKDVDISLAIQVYLADDFTFNDFRTVSIDDVYLEISYIIIETGDEDLSLLVLGLIAGIIALATIFTLYETHYKYPPMVRKVRKLRKKIKKGKKTKKPIKIKNRGDALKDSFDNQIKILELEIKPEIVDKVEKITKTEKIKELQKEVR